MTRPMWEWQSNYYKKNKKGEWLIGTKGSTGITWYRYKNLRIIDRAVKHGKMTHVKI